jgi:hypothetical protein
LVGRFFAGGITVSLLELENPPSAHSRAQPIERVRALVEPPAVNDASPLAGDMLHGAEAISLFIFGSASESFRNKIYHAASRKVSAAARLPTFRMGAVICARKSSLLAWIERQEAAAVRDAETE